jgi:hypothetical protein
MPRRRKAAVQTPWSAARYFAAARTRIVVLALIGFFLSSGSALGENPYAVAGISDPALVTQFLDRLKRAVASDERAAVAALINYPLVVHTFGGTARTYYSAAALRAGYVQVFTPEVKTAILAANADGLFARDQGVMIGDGEIWMNEIHGAIKIVALNHMR